MCLLDLENAYRETQTKKNCILKIVFERFDEKGDSFTTSIVNEDENWISSMTSEEMR